jgi:hypothetical protein
MKKISNITLIGYIASAIYLFVNINQYWIDYPDTSQFLMNLAISLLLAGVSFLYNRTLQQGYSINAMGEYLSESK